MHPHRRRKKRPNYGVRTVDVGRGQNGFGFTISGQQPCILSCIVADSPADAAGLRAGDFLISVNGLNVSKLPHDAVVQLIGNSVGVIKMAIAENYFSDSSDDDILNGRSVYNNRQRPKYPHTNRSRIQKMGKISNINHSAIKTANNVIIDHDSAYREYKPALSLNANTPRIDVKANISPSSSHSIILNTSISNTNDINNVSAMVNPGIEQVRAIKVVRDLKTGAMFEETSGIQVETDGNTHGQILSNTENQNDNSKPTSVMDGKLEPLAKIMEKQSPLECRAVVGYLGTIEMPKQIATSSKLQTVRSCIRKMRQEKRSPCTVLMTILPTSMTLKNSSGEILAEYPAKRINYVSCSSENDYRFFGLVTSTSYPIELSDFDAFKKQNNSDIKTDYKFQYDIAISNSCHVFMIDTQIVDHQNHLKKAEIFKINCTIDPVTGMCLEFPNNSEYIVNIIRIIYSLKFPNGFSGKCNIENVSHFSNMNRHSHSPRGSNFVRKINRPKFCNKFNNQNLNVHLEHNDQYQNEHSPSNMRELQNRQEPDVVQLNANAAVANSPQPSNHSEVTTASSNSDSGIGFHNDCQNISDRILVVDFPNPIHNNFNLNAPYMGPVFNPRDGKMIPLRENNRPSGVVSLDVDVDRQFLSNNTPVVEGFGGQGRPLNHMEPIMLENISNQISSQNIYLPKNCVGETSGLSNNKCEKVICDKNSVIQHVCVVNDTQKQMKNKLTVRAMPDNYGHNMMKKCDTVISQNHNNLQQSDHDQQTCIEESPHYDPVYSDGPACYEEHHYEIIYPDENNMQNENIANSKKLYASTNKYNWTEASQCIMIDESNYYSERAVDVPQHKLDYYANVSNCSYDNMSVTSSKSHEFGEKKCKNFSIDDISIYSSKSHDEIVTNSSKLKAKARKLQTSVDDILIFGMKKSKNKDSPESSSKKEKDNHLFLHPGNVIKLRSKKIKKPSIFPSKTKLCENDGKQNKKKSASKYDGKDTMLDYKLSPKVFSVSRPSVSVENICRSSERYERTRNWGHLEGTASEPDLRDCQNNIFFSTESGSPFSRWAGSASGRLPSHRSYRRPGSLVSSEHDMYTKCETDDKTKRNDKQQKSGTNGGVASWALCLERLLAEPSGVHALAAFLEREFSGENIRFWTACERWAHSPPAARHPLAAKIHKTHLADGASDPVNVDASARYLVASRLTSAPSDLFVQAQKQIFNLMKFDSYPRFIKSDIYKECLLAELEGRPSPYPGDPSLAIHPTNSSPSSSPIKIKKSLSNAEDKQRKSIIPWHRRQRSKSRDRCVDDDDAPRNRRPSDADNDSKGSNSSLITGWEMTRGLNHKQGELCRVIVPGLSATSVVPAVGGDETVKQLLDKLLDKRGVKFLAYDVFLPGCTKPIDISQSSSVLAEKDVTVEERIIFKLSLPNRKVVSVKAKPNKTLGEVLRPVLNKYVGGLDVNNAGGLYVMLDNKKLNLRQHVQDINDQRLQVVLCANPLQPDSALQNKTGNSHHINGNSQVNGTVTAVPSLDEITNRVFEELRQAKADKHAGTIEEESVKSDSCSSEHSSAIFGKRIKHRKPIPHPISNQIPIKSLTKSVSSEGGSSCCMEDVNCNITQKLLIAKLRAGVKVQNTIENNEYPDNMKHVQRLKIKDSMINNNISDFQKGKENNMNGKTISKFYDEKSCIAQSGANAFPIAAVRILPMSQSLAPVAPCPAPRLSLSQNSLNANNQKNEVNEADIGVKLTNNEYSPQKSAFNSLDNTVIENNQILDSTGHTQNVTGMERQISNSETQKSLNHGNLVHDYSTTSGSDHFTRLHDVLNSSFHSSSSSYENENCRHVSDPPPLPPKPKIQPIKPPNWGHNLDDESLVNLRVQHINHSEINMKGFSERNKRAVYLDQPSSSFV